MAIIHDPTTLNRLYGRAKGRPLRVYQQGLVDDLLHRLLVPAEGDITAERLFGHQCPLHFEIGLAAVSIRRSAPICCPATRTKTDRRDFESR